MIFFWLLAYSGIFTCTDGIIQLFSLTCFFFIVVWHLKQKGLISEYYLKPPHESIWRLIVRFFCFFIPPLLNLFFLIYFPSKNTYHFASVFLCLFTVFFEELFFRGWLQNRLKGMPHYILLTNLLFGLFHFVNLFQGKSFLYVLSQTIISIGFGICFSIMTIETKSLFPAVFFHFIFNAAAYEPASGFDTVYQSTILIVSAVCFIVEAAQIRKGAHL